LMSAELPMTRRILLAEDDNDMRRFLERALEQAGYRVVSFDNGLAAYNRLREEPFELLLTDIVMPEMDGIEATAHIRQHMQPPMQQVPVILLTANVNAQDHLRGLHAGINALMVKPFDRSKLCALIEEQLLMSATFLQRLAQER